MALVVHGLQVEVMKWRLEMALEMAVGSWSLVKKRAHRLWSRRLELELVDWCQ